VHTVERGKENRQGAKGAKRRNPKILGALGVLAVPFSAVRFFLNSSFKGSQTKP
jgi:hypothetical protein